MTPSMPPPAAEEHDHVSVGLRLGLVIDSHGLPVEEDRFLLAEEGAGRPTVLLDRRLAAHRAA